jgi:hypothetical protein
MPVRHYRLLFSHSYAQPTSRQRSRALRNWGSTPIVKPQSVGVMHCIITKYCHRDKSLGINASDIQTRYGTQSSVNSTHLQSSQFSFLVLFSCLFDGIAHYGFASSLSIQMLYTALRFPLAHIQSKFCTAMLNNKITNAPWTISLRGVVTSLLNR